MSERSIRSRTLTLALAIAAVLAMFSGATASAQFKCDPVRIINTTRCEIKGAFVSPFSNIAVPFTAGPGQTVLLPFNLPIQSVEVIDACGLIWGLQQTGCLSNIPAQGGCCFDFCLDIQNCTVIFKQAAGPCPC